MNKVHPTLHGVSTVHGPLRTLRDGFRSSVGRRFALLTVTCSTVIALLMTILQLLIDYRTETSLHSSTINKIETSTVPGLAESLWLLDDTLINSQLMGIAQIEGVFRVELSGDGETYVATNPTDQDASPIEFPVLRTAWNGETSQLGTLVIFVSHDHILLQVIQRGLVILATNFLKTICVVFTILFIFQHLVGRHITQLATFADNFDPETKGQRLSLDSTNGYFSPGDDSEFSALETSINRLSHTADVRMELLHNANREQAEFTYAISHDLKSPTNTIRMLIDELEENVTIGKGGQSILGDMKLTTQRMGRLVDGVLDYSQLVEKNADFESVDLDTLVSDIVTDLAGDISNANARIEFDALATVVGNPLQLRILFQNLISNAIKFRRPEVPPVVAVTTTREQRDLIVMVSDNGIGIPTKYRENVFGLFQRLHTRREYEGTGLGLTICRRVMTNHGGSISSMPGSENGTTFKMIFQENQND